MRSQSFPWHCRSWHCLPPGLLSHVPLCALLTWPALFHATSHGKWGRPAHTIAPQLASSAVLRKHPLILIQRLIPIMIHVIICANVYLLSASHSGEQRLMLSYSLTYPQSLAQGLAHANVSASTCGVRKCERLLCTSARPRLLCWCSSGTAGHGEPFACLHNSTNNNNNNGGYLLNT